MTVSLRIALVLIAAVALAQQAGAQESKAAKYTREKLKQVIAEIDDKEVGAKAFFEDVNRELGKALKFKIDGTTGISNNTKLSYKGKKVTVEKLLNDISDKYEFGWIVISNPGNNKEDGNIVIRKAPRARNAATKRARSRRKRRNRHWKQSATSRWQNSIGAPAIRDRRSSIMSWSADATRGRPMRTRRSSASWISSRFFSLRFSAPCEEVFQTSVFIVRLAVSHKSRAKPPSELRPRLSGNIVEVKPQAD